MPSPALTYYEYLTQEMLEKMIARDKMHDGSSTFSAIDGILNCRARANDEKAWVYWNVYLPIGATIEVSFEGRNVVPGSSGRMTIDMFPDNSKVGGGQKDWIEMEDGGFKPYSIGHTSTKNGYCSLTFGLWKALVGECEFRNIAIKIYGGTQRPEVRQCMLTCEAGTTKWQIDDKFGRFANMGVISVEYESDVKRLKVNYAKMNSWHRPLITAAVSYSTDFVGYTVQPYAQTNDYAYLYIASPGGTKVGAPAKGQTDMFVTFTAQGF